MKRFLLVSLMLTAALLAVLISELTQLGTDAGASGAAAAPSAGTTPPPPPSHAELRERYRKRLEELAKQEEEAQTKQAPEGPTASDLQELHAKLKERAKALDTREAEIQAKETELKDKQEFLQQQLGKYEATLGKLRQELKSLEAARDEKVSAFRQVYEKMESKKAARILDELDSELASRILAGMKQQQAAEILGKMDPEKARRITKRFLSSSGQPRVQ